MQLDDALRARYVRDGYLVFPSLFSATEIAPSCRETERLIEAARGKSESDDVHDLEDSHEPDGEPRVRRIKDPVQQFDLYSLVWLLDAVGAGAGLSSDATSWPVGESLNRMDSFVMAGLAWLMKSAQPLINP